MTMSKFDKLKKSLEKASLRKEKDIAKRYAALYQEINQTISKYVSRYEKDGLLTYHEMAKHNRLEKLLKDVNKLINGADTGLRNEIHGHLRSQFKESYYQSAFILETGSKAKLGYTTVKDEVLDAAINNNFNGLTLNERLSKRRGDLIYSMRESITRGLVEGQTYRGMANIIKDELEGDLVKANRIVRTESHRIRESGGLESVLHAKSKGVIMTKTWNTVSDERVRDRHAKLDGVTIDADEQFEVNGYKADAPTLFGVAELDINCRCFLSYEIVKVEKPEHEEIADLNYAEWQKERLS